MKELKKLTTMELIRFRAMQQLAHQIGYMNNDILRSADNLERYKVRNNLKMILKNIDDRLALLETRVYSTGGSKITFNNFLPRYLDKSTAFFIIQYIDKNTSTLSLRFMRGYSVKYIIELLIRIRKRLMVAYDFKKSNLPKCQYSPTIITNSDDEIIDMDCNTEIFEKYKYIYNSLKDNIELNKFYPDIRFEDGLMKIINHPDDECLLYFDPKEKLIVSLPIGFNDSDNYVYRRKALNKIIREIDKLIYGGIQ